MIAGIFVIVYIVLVIGAIPMVHVASPVNRAWGQKRFDVYQETGRDYLLPDEYPTGRVKWNLQAFAWPWFGFSYLLWRYRGDGKRAHELGFLR